MWGDTPDHCNRREARTGAVISAHQHTLHGSVETRAIRIGNCPMNGSYGSYGSSESP